MVAGHVLVDQTLVCEAARLLQDPPARHGLPSRRAERLMQLSLLLDAVLLYERLYVVGSELPLDADRLELRRALIDLDVLHVIDKSEYAVPVATELGTFLSQAHDATGPLGRRSASAEQIIDLVRAGIEGEPYHGLRRTFADRILGYLHRGSEGSLTGTRGLDRFSSRGPVLPADPVTAMGRDLMALIMSGVSGDVIPAGAAQLRTLLYWRISTHLNLPFYPSCRRLPQYYLMTNSVGTATQDAVYDAVAESFRATVEEVYEGDDPVPIYLPPSLALFLDYRRSGDDTRQAVQRLRAEFGPLRLALVRLQEDTGRAGSLKELHAAKTRFRQVLADIRATPGSSTAVVDQALDLVPAVASALTNPLDVTAYSASLVTTPQDWVRRWWQRRPYRLVFGLRDRLLAVRDYGGLLADGAGLHIDPAELTAFATDYEQYLAHFATYGPARRPA